MNKFEPLLSILLATKNRQKYCLSAVESILEINDSRIEVVVQDNSDDDSLRTMLAKFNHDKRLVYNYESSVLSFVDNFSLAIEHATGKYVCAIGDDDGINPEIISATQWASDNGYDALVGNVEANYRWAGTGAPDTFFTKMTDNTLTITHFTGRAKVVNVTDSLLSLMKNGATNYLDFHLPKLYHGVVKKVLFEKIKAQTGSYLKGLSPDIYAAIALACNINKLLVLDYPLTIPGVCSVSGSIQEGQKKSNSKRLEDAPHFRGKKITVGIKMFRGFIVYRLYGQIQLLQLLRSLIGRILWLNLISICYMQISYMQILH
ncbi:glycosyltransferase [Riemerella anatipestifer]